jgi:diadenylate cyclase
MFIAIIIVLNASILKENFVILPQLLNNFLLYIFVVILLLFPQELRRALWRLSSPKSASTIYNAAKGVNEQELRKVVVEVVKSLQNMAKKNIGVLLVVVPDNSIGSHILDSGTTLDAKLTGALLESIFITKGPLHDGAVIAKGDKILSAGCFLPLTQSQTIAKTFGTRHRAAIGVTENSNAISIICSEETGVISVAKDGVLKSYYDGIMLQDILEQVLGLRINKSVKVNLE